jgi:hypothetical protein
MGRTTPNEIKAWGSCPIFLSGLACLIAGVSSLDQVR